MRELIQSDIVLTARELGLPVTDREPWEISTMLADLSYQRRAKHLGASTEIFEDPTRARLFLQEQDDLEIKPGNASIGSIISYLEQTQLQETKLSDFPFFHKASQNQHYRQSIDKLAGYPSWNRDEKFFEEKLKRASSETKEFLDQQDKAGLTRDVQFLPENAVRRIRKQLFETFLVGAHKFTPEFLPDWYWPITWSRSPIFGPAREINKIMEAWESSDHKPTTNEAFLDISRMYMEWLEASIQHKAFSDPKHDFLKPHLVQKLPNWGQHARGLR